MSFQYWVAARTIWGEARGEGPDGIRAVAHVLINRKNSKRWGESLAETCLWPGQFSCWSPGGGEENWQATLRASDEDAILLQCYGAVVAADKLEDADPTGGALHYFADTMVQPPAWASTMRQTAHIGHHIFWRP